MTIGRYAIAIGNGFYYNSITHQVCVEEELGPLSMLAGQEQQAVFNRIFSPGDFQILLIPSFECNLRCPQCYVGHLLAKPSGNRIGNTDPERLIAFVQRASERLGPLKILGLVGGEPFLHSDAFRMYLDAGLAVGATTNGIFNFDDVKDIIGRLHHLTFSIDGWPEQHNRTRKSLDPAIDPFVTTYRNLCRTIDAFPKLDVVVQGSIIDDNITNVEQIFRYVTLMLGAGVKPDKITLGPCAATVKRGAIREFMRSVSTSMRRSPCCDHSFGKGFVIYQNAVYDSYYRIEESAPIGALEDSIDQILSKKKELIINSMPMLNDNVCMNECKAVGICWGICTSARHVFKDGKPSSVCDRAFKEAEVARIATTLHGSQQL